MLVLWLRPFFFVFLVSSKRLPTMTDKTATAAKSDKMETERDPSISYKDYDVESYLANYLGHTKDNKGSFHCRTHQGTGNCSVTPRNTMS